jgi:hypothetical protein
MNNQHIHDAVRQIMRQVGFTDIQVVDKVNAEAVVTVQPGMPRIYSARITARKG